MIDFDGQWTDVVFVSDQAYDAFREAYARAMLWANACDSDNEPIDLAHAFDGPGRWWEGIGIDFTDADEFLRQNYDDLLSASDDMGQHGHDFALTRNGHGAGFWDRGYGYELGERLTDRAHAFGPRYLYLNNDDTLTDEKG